MATKSAMQQLNDLIAQVEGDLLLSTPTGSSKPVAATSSSSSAAKNSAPKAPKAPKAAAKAEEPKNEVININSIDLRVGIIRKVAKHETAEKLYVEEIDVGEAEPRQIASGLVPYYTLEQMQDRKLIVVCNLKPRNLVGFKSHGMVLCASKTDDNGNSTVEFVDPPVNAQPGDRIFGEGLTNEPLAVNRCDKTKAFEVVAPDLKINGDGVAVWQSHRLVTAAGEGCSAPTLRDAHIK